MIWKIIFFISLIFLILNGTILVIHFDLLWFILELNYAIGVLAIFLTAFTMRAFTILFWRIYSVINFLLIPFLVLPVLLAFAPSSSSFSLVYVIMSVLYVYPAIKQAQIGGLFGSGKAKKTAKPKKGITIGGWLILIAINLITQLIEFGGLIVFLFFFAPWVNDPFHIFESFAVCIFFLCNILLVFLFFKKKSKFPMYFIIFLISFAVYRTLDQIIAILLFPHATQYTSFDSWQPVIRAVSPAVIWTWYMLKSKRVKQTFVQ